MDKTEYLEYCWNSVEDWIEGIEEGRIISNEYVKQAIQRYKEDLQRTDIYFDKDKVDRVLRFLWYMRINKKNKYVQFIPLPYQIFFILNVFGFYWYTSGKRRYRYAYLFTARKSGKTTFAAALQLYGLMADGVVDPQSLLLANTREQASIALSYMTGIIRKSPALRKRLETQRYMVRFTDRTKGGYSKILASNASRLDGYSPNMALIDECHAMENHDIFNVIKSGTLARENPLIIIISTAGFNTNSMAFDLFNMGKRVLKKEVKDDSFFYLFFTLDDNDDWKDTSTWVKANPSLGTTIFLDDLILEYNQAKSLPTQLNNFLTKNLNIFTNEGEDWIPDMVLRPLFVDINWDEYRGRSCYAGVDLSSTRDLTAITLSFPEDDGSVTSRTIAFSANNPSKLIRQNGVDIMQWIRTGFIVQSRTKTIDYDLLYRSIEELNSLYKIEKLYYDKFNSAMLIPRLQSGLGIICENFEQNARRFNEPLKYLEKLIYDKKWRTDKNGALLWNFHNIVLYIDGNGNIKIVKNKSLDSVDLVVSLGMSIGALLDSKSSTFDLSAFELN